jgi:2-polyprenyl-3-methyl-5-hydroxy-6-metoxy-1,4-benzoquinol methylase
MLPPPGRSTRRLATVAKYYRAEHEDAYARIEREGKSNWDELHGGTGFDDFSSRAFLEQVLPTLGLRPAEADVLEYGCGTGSGACFLAARGFRVDAIDLVPRAITLARRFAAERGLAIDFRVADMCALADVTPEKRYDLVVDTYCLQSIVTDADRARLFAAVRARLKHGGRYLVSTAMYEPERRYEGALYDEATGVVLDTLDGAAERHRGAEGAVQVDGRWYLPHRRHVKPAAPRAELEAAGFRVLSQGGRLGGDVVCALARGRD